jgi:hypothetical protein
MLQSIRMGVLFLQLFAVSHGAHAVTVKLAPTGAMMLQPSSSWYHAAFGLTLDLQTKDQKFVTRLAALERPEFKANGYEDKDWAGFFLFGSKVASTKFLRLEHSINAFAGPARVGGSIRSTHSFDEVKKRSFAMNGPAFGLEWSTRLGSVEVAAGHMMFVGFGDETQSRAFVAWPWNFFTATLGWLI